MGPQGMVGEPGIGLPGPKVINSWTQIILIKCSLIKFTFEAQIFLYYFQGDRGPPGLVGPQGFPGEGYPGPQVCVYE